MSKCLGGTERCIICLKKAKAHGGHVLKDKDYVLAGWCEDHVMTPSINLMNTEGCYGGWHEKYGLKDD